MSDSLKLRIAAGEPLVGTWVKTPSPMVCEVLGATELDLVCLDAEHSPFDRLVQDQCLHALRAAGMPALVRCRRRTTSTSSMPWIAGLPGWWCPT